MPRFLLLLALLWVALLPPPPAAAMTDEEARRAFLKAREEMRTEPAEASTPAPKAKPKPRKSTPTPAPTAKPTPAPTPEETPTPTPKPKPPETAKPKHKHQAEPSETPRKKKKPQPERTPIPETRPAVTPEPEKPARTPWPEATPKPTPAPTPPPRVPVAPAAPVTIEKSGMDETTGFEPPPPPPPKRHWWQFGFNEDTTHYKYLSRAVRDAIDRAPVARHRWRYIVVHNSGTRQGNAKIFDYYHRHTRKMPNGLAYHFVIGNGSSSGNGQIEIGSRWTRQINGGHVHSDYLNNIALGICLVGDFNRDHVNQVQLDALDELIRYLRRRVGKIDRKDAIVKAHRDINPPQWPTDCPGDKFPYSWLYGRFP